MKSIKLNFADFWGGFNIHDNYFIRLLSKKFSIQISDKPDFLIYSCYGRDHLRYNCYRIFYIGENQRVNWDACDFVFGFDYIKDKRYYRLPNWVLYDDPHRLVKENTDVDKILTEKAGFCNLVVSNGLAKERIAFFHQLSKYKKVDSGGKFLNNIGGAVQNKRNFQRKYKFSIAFENSSSPGYTTEKLFEPMLENSIPIYWGNPLVHLDFNPASFVNYHDYNNADEVVARIIELDKKEHLYTEMLEMPWYHNNQMPAYLEEENILGQFGKIFSTAWMKPPVAQTFRRHINRFRNILVNSEYYLNGYLKYRKNFR